MGISVITRNFQVTLPKDVRELSKIEEGDKVIVEVDDAGRIVMNPLKKSPVDDSFGAWEGEVEGVKYTNALRGEWGARAEG